MARLPDELIQRLKSDVSLQRLVEGSGVDLKPHGADWIGHCPFMMTKPRPWWSAPPIICGTAWGLPDRWQCDRLGDAPPGCFL